MSQKGNYTVELKPVAFKLRVLWFFERIMLQFTPVTHATLVELGFNVDNLFYKLADLCVYVDKNKYYFYSIKGRKTTIRNMRAVGKLIFGQTKYLVID